MNAGTSTLALVLAAFATGCGPQAEQASVRQVEPEPSAAAAPINPAFAGTITMGNREFGLALYKALAVEPGNVFISPIGIAGAFGPVVAGAEGETRTAIARAALSGRRRAGAPPRAGPVHARP